MLLKACEKRCHDREAELIGRKAAKACGSRQVCMQQWQGRWCAAQWCGAWAGRGGARERGGARSAECAGARAAPPPPPGEGRVRQCGFFIKGVVMKRC